MGDEDAYAGKSLLNHGAQETLLGLHGVAFSVDACADLVHPQAHEGQRRQGPKGQDGIDAEHHTHGEEHHGDQGQAIHDGGAQIHAHLGDVLRDAVHQVTRGVLLVKAKAGASGTGRKCWL